MSALHPHTILNNTFWLSADRCIFWEEQQTLILSDLHVKYTYQGRSDLEGTCSPRQIDKEAVKKVLDSDGKYLQKLETLIRDKNGKDVATVTTTWQLKSWDQVKTLS